MFKENDLISRSALIAYIGELGNDPEDNTVFVTMRQAVEAAHKCISDMVKAAPAVNAVVVVRCRDCKHWVDGFAGCTEHIKACEYGGYMVGGNGYCVYGERRADDD